MLKTKLIRLPTVRYLLITWEPLTQPTTQSFKMINKIQHTVALVKLTNALI